MFRMVIPHNNGHKAMDLFLSDADAVDHVLQVKQEFLRYRWIRWQKCLTILKVYQSHNYSGHKVCVVAVSWFCMVLRP